MFFEATPKPSYVTIIATFLWAVIIGSIAWSLVFITRLFYIYKTIPLLNVLVTMLNVMFVFFVAFMASDVYQLYNSARNAMIDEGAAINRLLNIPGGSAKLKNDNGQYIKKY